MVLEGIVFRYALVAFDIILFINMVIIGYIAVKRSVVVKAFREKNTGEGKTLYIKEVNTTDCQLKSARVVVVVMWQSIITWMSYTVFLTFRYELINFLK